MRRLLSLVWRLGWRLGVLAIALVAAGSITWRYWPSDPSGFRRGGGFVDLHVHVAGLGVGCDGCYVNPTLERNVRFPFFLKAMNVTQDELTATGDTLVVERLAAALAESSRVSSAVILAMDGAVDAAGELDLAATQLYVPNAYVAAQARAHPELHFGASVNPLRPDALARLEQVVADGAVLIKWIPAIQHFAPDDPVIVPFYERMVGLNLPLLTHAGQERSFAHAEDEYSDPQRLRLPLSLGVTVIAAHIGTTGIYEGQPSYDRLLPLFDEFPNLYADVSSLTQINKRGYLRHALTVPGLPERLLYGSDWPLQMFPLVHPTYQWPHLKLTRARAIADLPNTWDRDVALKEALGVPPGVFARTAQVLRLSPAREDSAGQ
ncbi:MAG: amidohydrolase family protein [Pseudomonadota bacterium]